jgi:hypothetical protein
MKNEFQTLINAFSRLYDEGTLDRAEVLELLKQKQRSIGFTDFTLQKLYDLIVG